MLCRTNRTRLGRKHYFVWKRWTKCSIRKRSDEKSESIAEAGAGSREVRMKLNPPTGAQSARILHRCIENARLNRLNSRPTLLKNSDACADTPPGKFSTADRTRRA